MSHRDSQNVCVIVLNWNNWPDTLTCLKSLRKLASRPSTIIVCDNGSTDDSQTRILEWAQAHYKQDETLIIASTTPFKESSPKNRSHPPLFVYLQNDSNRGFSGGNNLGLRWARRQKHYDYFWLLNNDTKVEPDSLSALLECSSQNQTVGIWGSTVCWMDDPDKIQCAGGCTYSPATTIFKHTLANHYANDVTHMKSTPHLDYIFGAGFFVKSMVFEEVGLLSEDYFLFYEELDFCIRARLKGYEMGWCKGSIIYHKGSASVGVYDGTNAHIIAKANYYENLGTLKITRKFYPHLLPIAMIFRFCGKLFLCCRRRHFFLIRPLFAAYREFFKKYLWQRNRNRRQI